MHQNKQLIVFRIATGFFFFMSGLCFSSWSSRIPEIQEGLGLSTAAWGNVLLASPVGSFVMIPVAGASIIKFGSRSVMLSAIILYAIMLCMLAFSHELWQFVLSLFFYGGAGNLLNISANTQASGVEKLYGKSIMASFHGLWSLAGFCGAYTGNMMIGNNIIPLNHFILIASVIIIVAIIVSRFAVKEDSGRTNSPLLVLPDASLLLLGCIAFSGMMCEGCMFYWTGIYFRDVLQTPKELTAIGFTVFMFCMATARFTDDFFISKFGPVRMLRIFGALVAAGLFIAVLSKNVYTVCLGFGFTGIGISVVVPLVYSMAGKHRTIAPGLAISAVSAIGFIGFVAGPPLIGFIAGIAGLQWSFTFIACMGIVLSLLAVKLKVKTV